MSDATLSLAQGFPSIDETVWKSLVEQSLKGGAFDKKINRVAEDGFAIKGLYTTVEQDFAKLNFPQTSWTILQEQHNLCGEDANQAILDDLENGVNGLLLHVGDDVAALDKALVSVMLDLVQLSIRAPENETAVVEKLFSLAGQNQLTGNQIKLDVGADPITVAAVSGQLGKG